ncbi:tannase and feruloyl esterase [Hyaloscypha variabilis F]|uniref:Carboxylic ester hydrolase n=1 Tax=Hyaloscypha variabilis (strain UAMH 11265 / GT02V1 / F) TaxID=1149755 RepID=A0A2J6QWG3_HYAVF|nr:tannase and feruloyl esterase [Hyaloscypha variabilis F]
MRNVFPVLIVASFASVVVTTTRQSVCTLSYVKQSLPTSNFGLTIDPASVVVSSVTNASVNSQTFFPSAHFDYCSVTFAYSHDGLNDSVHVMYWLPASDKFQNRYLSTGGGGFAISSGIGSLPGGIMYGAVAGTTDGGFGSFNTQSDAVFLVKNGTVNLESLYMFGYEAHHELSLLGKALTKQFFNMSSTKLYSYYQGCSEGGLDSRLQKIQRYGNEWDGAITGAPAFCFSHQQVQHLYSNVVEQTLGYYPPPCELEKIVNETIAFCDPLDGKTDGVVSRSDLRKLHFNLNSTIGKPYSCPARPPKSKRQFPNFSPSPAQNGTVSAEGGAVVAAITDSLRDSKGRRVYFSYQPAAGFVDAQTQYNAATNSWGLSVRSIMYPNMSFNDSTTALNDWYRLFLVPGAGHCGPSTAQPNGPWPQTSLAVLIDWVENGIEPTTLDATVLQGKHLGEQQQICGWPLRPYWPNDETSMECQYDQASTDSWLYDLDAFKLPVY